MITAKNPILSGFYPDPSICRVGEMYYLVNSTFAYFPGVPIFQSKDLANWEQIGNVLDRPSQLPLNGCGQSGGIFAPTIRFYDGTYYMITTNVTGGGNFVVTAKNPEGPWSEPYYLDAPGIDPSLFFDTDGTCYYVGTRPNPEGCRYGGDWEVWCQQMDLDTMKLVGDSYPLWNGALKDVVWPEGPHLYKKDEFYYLMIAEGGTGPDHCITVARSSSVFGPYEGCRRNPIITHRHLGSDYPVVYVGHGDLVETADGNWYMVMLASRPCDGYTNLGRETFLAKVEWEHGWPVVNPGVGKLEETLTYEGTPCEVPPIPAAYGFAGDKLPYEFIMLRNPSEKMYSLTERRGNLRMYLQAETLKEEASPSYIGVRQRHQNYQVMAGVEFAPEAGGEAGIAVVQSNEYHLRLVLSRTENGMMAKAILCEAGQDKTIGEAAVLDGYGIFCLVNRRQKADVWYMCGNEKTVIAQGIDMHNLSTEAAGGFVGCTVGMYASGNGNNEGDYCDFQWFSYQELEGNK